MINRIIIFVVFLMGIFTYLPIMNSAVKITIVDQPEKITFVDTYTNLRYESSKDNNITVLKSLTSFNPKVVRNGFTMSGELICIIDEPARNLLADSLSIKVTEIPHQIIIPVESAEFPKNSSCLSFTIKINELKTPFLRGQVLIDSLEFTLDSKQSNKVTKLFCTWVKLNADGKVGGGHPHRFERDINHRLAGLIDN